LLDALNTLISDRNSSVEVFLKTDTDLSLLQHFFQDELPLLNSKSQDILSHLRQTTPALHHTRQSRSACLVARQSALQDLDRAYQTFIQLHTHLDEGYSFYANLIAKMQTIHGEAEDFVVSRRLEADELKAKIEADMEAELRKMPSYQQLPNASTGAQQGPAVLTTASGYPTQAPLHQHQQPPPVPTVYPGQWNPSIPISYASTPSQPTSPHQIYSTNPYYPPSPYGQPPRHPAPPQPYQQPPFSPQHPNQQYYGTQPSSPPQYPGQQPYAPQQGQHQYPHPPPNPAAK
jgi:hypothetical protein